ncbi:MAG TPA: lysylphosphatidylglycerol synthase transmembrane domain-containing protein [Jatrophihabitans sp.]
MRRAVWRWARLMGAAAILAVLVWRVGTGPFLDGLRAVDASAVGAAVVLGAITTVCAAWRWTAIARGFGRALPFRSAIAEYYRAQFLNTALPAGVLGDVNRGVRHGLRAVVWERVAGQVVQVAIALVLLSALPGPARAAMSYVVLAVVAVLLAVAVVLVRSRAVRAELNRAFGSSWRAVLAASAVVVAGHTATFLIAAHTAGVHASPARLLPLAMLVLIAMAVPLNLGGWGPREGVAAWAFGAVGLGAGAGVATATVYGVLVIAACLPGAVVLLAKPSPRLESEPREKVLHG